MTSKITHCEVLEAETFIQHQYIYFQRLWDRKNGHWTSNKPAVNWKTFSSRSASASLKTSLYITTSPLPWWGDVETVQNCKIPCVTFAERRSFEPHVNNAISKTEQKRAGLTRLMPNIRGPSSGKKAVLCTTVHNLPLYNAPILRKAVEIQKYRRILEKSTEGHAVANDFDVQNSLPGDDSFRVIAKRINSNTHDKFIYCGKTDTPGRTIFDCTRWNGPKDAGT